MLNKTMLAFAISAVFSAQALASASEAESYFRSPSLQQNQLLFTSEGNIWQADLEQLRGQRLTTHPTEEVQARLSADGEWLAFVASYEQTPELYVKPASGGVAKRVTFENSRVRLQGWTPDGKLLYATDHVAGPANFWLLKTVDPISLTTNTLPVADAIEGTLDSRGEWLYFVQHGLQATGDNARTYRGGALGELWRYQLGSEQEAEQLSAQHQGSIRQPMYWQERVYFVSDASGNPNIWSMQSDGRDLQQHTQHQDWQVRQAYLNQGRIVYQLGADIHLLDISSGEDRLLQLSLQSDRPHQRERWLDNPLNYLTSAHYAGFGDQVVLTARGQVAITAKSPSRLFEIATPAASRVREAILSHDGKWVYAISDQSGELEIWRYAADGREQAKQLTKDGAGFRWQLALSPDGNWLAHDDKAGNLWLLDLKTLENRKAITGGVGLFPFADIRWSHDSELIAVTTIAARQQRSQVLLYSVSEQKQQLISSSKYESYSPSFSPDGNWLYFLSNRHFRATPGHPWGDRNLGPMFDRRSQIFAVSLKAQAVFPFQPPTELPAAAVVEEPARRGRRAATPARVEWQGLNERLWQVPVPAGNYSQLTVTEQRLFVRESSYEADSAPALKVIKIDDRDAKIEQYAAAIADYQVSHDGKQLYFRKHQRNGAGPMYVVEVGDREPSELNAALLNSKQWQLTLDPKQEWRQMFHDAWLMQREFLFDKTMRGLDWNDARARYQALVERVSDRHELDDVLAQMMGELDVLHSQVRGGEYPDQRPTPAAASLGASLETTSAGVRVAHIYRTDPELPTEAAPLAQPGVNARVGDIITAVNGRKVSNQADVQLQLRNQVGQQVLLDLKRGNNQLQTVVVPVNAGRDHQLRYQDWVFHNAAKVQEASDSQFGYLHLYAMGPNDIANFAREFYANVDKDGLIIDVRRNRGGNIDSWIIEKLLRRAWAFWQPTQGGPYTNMQHAFRGHLVVLTDQLTYSDGETFAAGVKALQLGPLVGMRTTGAGVWLTGRNALTDRGMARVAETAQFAMDGRYVIEGYGVEPDYEVRNMPVATFKGEDAQLNFAIDYLTGKLQREPIPELKADPVSAGPAADIVR